MKSKEDPVWIDINTSLKRWGTGRTTFYDLLGKGLIEARKLGSKTLVNVASGDRYYANLPKFGRRRNAMLKRKNPGAGKRQGFENGSCFPTLSRIEASSSPQNLQSEFSTIEWLAARTRVSVSTARLFAELHCFGEARP